MATRNFAAFATALCLAGCAAVNPYPAAWEPLYPSAAADCKLFQGGYSDKADSRDNVKPSLTRELFCDAGRLILRNTRWVRADVMIAREKAKLTLHKVGDHLVTEVEDALTGLFFVIVPIVGSVTNWYRFAKMP